MGSCYFYVTKEEPAYNWNYDKLIQNTIVQGYASELDFMWQCLPKHLRDKYPMLRRIDYESGVYIDENLNLSPIEVNELAEELQKIVNILAYQDFEPGLDAKQFKHYLETVHSGFKREELNENLAFILQMLNTAKSERAWIRISR
jgi:hypothetical protein